jgi:phosphate transporter
MHELLNLYAKCVTKNDASAAQRQLKLHQREHIAWERDTVWRQMIGRERRGEGGQPKAIGSVLEVEEDSMALHVRTPFGALLLTRKRGWLFVAFAMFTALLNVQAVKGVEANRCFAILVFATIMWATEVGIRTASDYLVKLILC